MALPHHIFLRGQILWIIVIRAVTTMERTRRRKGLLAALLIDGMQTEYNSRPVPMILLLRAEKYSP